MTTLTVGSGMQYATIAQAVAASSDNDVIQVEAGTYVNQFAQINDSITLEAVDGGVTLDATSAPLGEKGIFIIGDGSHDPNVTIDGFTFEGAKISESEGNNGAGIRYQGGNLTLNNDAFRDNQDGLLATPFVAHTGTIIVNNSTFTANGAGDGQSHNIYVNHISQFTFEDSVSTDAIVGHDIKSRADNTTIINSTISDGPTGTASYEIDLPNGGNTLIQGNTIEQGPDSQNPVIISYGEEGGVLAGSTLTVTGNTILNDLHRNAPLAIRNSTTVVASITNNQYYGLTAAQLDSGPAVLSNNTLLAVEPNPTNGDPTWFTAPATVAQGAATAIGGVSLSESGNTVGETFTATLADANGDLSATGAGVSGSGTTHLTVSGSLAQVNADLATLSDTDNVTPSDTITLNASDSRGGAAATATIAVTVAGTVANAPVITAPASATVGQNQPTPIAGVGLSETGAVAGETFTVSLTDVDGLLGATGTGVSGAGTTSLTISGSLAQVNADLATLKDTDASTASDTITLNATDNLGNAATAAATAVTVNGVPVIAAPAAVTLGQNQTAPIAGVSLSEAGSTGGETFTVTVADAHGNLSAMGTGVSGSGTTHLTISGSLAQVDTDLATLTDDDASTASDTITLNATDSLGNSAAAKAIAATVSTHPLPVIAAPASAIIGQTVPTSIAGVSLSESGAVSGETFTVTLADAHGDLAATGTGVSGSGTTNLTVSGSLAQVNVDLATLKDTDGVTPSDTITLNATDSLGNAATTAAIAVTVNGPPVISASGSATVAQGTASAVAGVSLSESGNTAGETFTVTLADANGDLSATGTGVSGAGTMHLTVSGSLAQVNSDLGTLADDDASTASDTIMLNASDSLGNSASAKAIAVAVLSAGHTFFTLTKGPDTVSGGAGNDTIIAPSATLSAGDSINGGGGSNTLELQGSGIFNLKAPTTLTNIQTLTAQEGQAAFSDGTVTIAAQNQILDLRDGLDATVNVSPATLNPSNPRAATITIVGANNASVINLATGNDVVTLGSTRETVHGGTGNDTILVTAATIGATIDGGSGNSTLDVTGGGTAEMGANITDISAVTLGVSATNWMFIANATSGLTVTNTSNGADTIQAGGLGQTLISGGGNDLLAGFTGGATIFAGPAAALNGDTIVNFGAAADLTDFTDIGSAMSPSALFVENGSNTAGTLTVSYGTHSAAVTLKGAFSPSLFHVAPDGSGTAISYH